MDRGIGAGIALLLGKRGANVVVNYVGAAARAEKVVKAIEDAGSRAVAVQADVSKPTEHEKLVTAALGISTTGKIEVIVHKSESPAPRPPPSLLQDAFADLLFLQCGAGRRGKPSRHHRRIFRQTF